MNARDRLIVALDVESSVRALELVDVLKSEVSIFKIGFELFSYCGPSIVKEVAKKGCRVFLDLKFHDIPNTVSKASLALTGMGVFMFNMHGLGGYDMMKKASESACKEAQRLKVERPKMLAVTVLTSMDENGLKKVGIGDSMDSEVLRLAELAKSAGLDGVVASVSEARLIRKKLGKDFIVVTPGVRPSWSETGDQKRVATPEEAIASGADYIVIGRPITGAEDPLKAAKKILEEMGR